MIFWQSAQMSLPWQIAIGLSGRLLLMLGGMRWAEEKGYHRRWGLLGLLGLLGAIILLVLPSQRPGSQRPTWVNRNVLITLALFSLVLIRDSMVGRVDRWLPSVLEPLIFSGPALLVGSVAYYFRLLADDHGASPHAITLWRVLRWGARILGLLLVAAPSLTMFFVALNRPPGVRPGNEGEGLGIAVIFFLCLPPGLVLTLVSFLPRRPVPPPLPPVDAPTDSL